MGIEIQVRRVPLQEVNGGNGEGTERRKGAEDNQRRFPAGTAISRSFRENDSVDKSDDRRKNHARDGQVIHQRYVGRGINVARGRVLSVMDEPHDCGRERNYRDQKMMEKYRSVDDTVFTVRSKDALSCSDEEHCYIDDTNTYAKSPTV